MLHLDNANFAHAKMGCYLCTNPNDIVDTEVTIDYEGVLVICTGCVRDMAIAAGFDLEHAAADYERLEEALVKAANERNSAQKALADIKDTTARASKAYDERTRRAAKR